MRFRFAISATSFLSFGYKKTAVKCSILQQSVSSFIQFWTQSPTANCSKSGRKGQGVPVQNQRKMKRGLGTLPYGNSPVQTIDRKVWEISPVSWHRQCLLRLFLGTPGGCAGCFVILKIYGNKNIVKDYYSLSNTLYSGIVSSVLKPP